MITADLTHMRDKLYVLENEITVIKNSLKIKDTIIKSLLRINRESIIEKSQYQSFESIELLTESNEHEVMANVDSQFKEFFDFLRLEIGSISKTEKLLVWFIISELPVLSQAKVLGVSQKSLRMSRYRLKRKFIDQKKFLNLKDLLEDRYASFLILINFVDVENDEMRNELCSSCDEIKKQA